MSPEFRRVTTTVHLRGRGAEGRGEDVTYQPDLHDPFPVPDVAGRGRSARSRIRSRASASSRSSPRITPRSTTGAGAGRARRSTSRSRRRARASATSSVASRARSRTSSRRVWTRSGRCSSSTRTRGSSSIRIPTGATRRSTVSPRAGASTPPTSRACTAARSASLRTRSSTGGSPRRFRRHGSRIRGSTTRRTRCCGRTAPGLPGTRRSTRLRTRRHCRFRRACLNVKPSRFGTVRRLFEFYEWCEARGVAHVRRRPVRARDRADADPGACVPVPSGHAERRGAERVQPAGPAAGRPALAASAAARFRHEVLTDACAGAR